MNAVYITVGSNRRLKARKGKQVLSVRSHILIESGQTNETKGTTAFITTPYFETTCRKQIANSKEL
jgi:hypothetical protein